MSTRAERWQARQAQAAAAAPRVTLHGGRACRRWFRRGWAVTIRGVDLYPVIVPPRVVVGGHDVHHLRWRDDGRVLRGVIDAAPRDDRIVVDYGFMRGEGRLTRG